MRFHKHITSLIASISFCFLLLSSVPSIAIDQDSLRLAKQYSSERYFRRSVLIDSLKSSLILIGTQQDSLRELLKNQKTTIIEGQEERGKLTEENTNLKQELNGAIRDNLQSSHTKKILFIFNLIIGIFLLIAAIWMFARKKSEPIVKPYNNSSASTLSVNSEGYDHKLERIEKLGNLRDKGLLTDDEFNLQKRQILGDRN